MTRFETLVHTLLDDFRDNGKDPLESMSPEASAEETAAIYYAAGWVDAQKMVMRRLSDLTNTD